MRIKELREDRNLTQSDIAKAINTSQSNIARWEKGLNEPSYAQLIKLADFFECSIDHIVGRADDFGNINITGNALALSSDEHTLLHCFQKLGPFEREAILIQIKALAGAGEKEVIKK